jgi:hypothetical protein
MDLFGIRIVQSQFPLEREVPIRQHKKRRSQSAAYHRRVQKKWTKRYGTRTERYALMFNPGAVGLPGGRMVALDPRDMVKLKLDEQMNKRGIR